jgi:two-component system sensor histidine kinase KdpD
MRLSPRIGSWLPPDSRAALIGVGGVAVALTVTTVAIAALEGWIGVGDASAAYILAVVACAVAFGSWAAVLASFGAFLLYDFFFIDPRHTFTVNDPGEWLTLLLLLAMGILVGQLAASQRSRAHAAEAREREARALFRVSRALATRASTVGVLRDIALTLRDEALMERVWISLGPDESGKRMADTGTGQELVPARQAVLRRTPGDAPAEWVDVVRPPGALSPDPNLIVFRVWIEAAGRRMGAIWSTRKRQLGDPGQAQTRLLAAAADQVGQALEQDRLAEEARERDIAVQGDALKSALLESVSHDLRTPLASIRAAAGILRDPDIPHSAEQTIAMGDAIDREAEHLNRLVSNLLDLSRIEAGTLRADLEPYEPIDIVERTLDRIRPGFIDRPVEVAVPDTLPPVLVDAVYIDQVLTNLLENARKYVPIDRPVRVTATVDQESRVVLTVEDGGMGVAPSELPRLFQKFYRVAGRSGSRPGTGIGLAVVQGLVEAMGGTVSARRSQLGGLAIDVVLRVAPSGGPATEGSE